MGYRAVVNQCVLSSAATCNVPVDCVVARIDHAPRKPSIERFIGIVEDPFPFPEPVDLFSRLGPETYRVVYGAGINLVILGEHRMHL